MWVAFIGSFVMLGGLLLGNMVASLSEVVSYMDFGTLALLFGMMVSD